MKAIIPFILISLLLATSCVTKQRKEEISKNSEDNVIDSASLFQFQEEKEIDSLISELREDVGIDFYVITLELFDGDIQTYTTDRLLHLSGSNQGKRTVLLVICKNPRNLLLYVTEDLASVLTSEKCSKINKEMAPYFREHKFAHGINAGLARVRYFLKEASTDP